MDVKVMGGQMSYPKLKSNLCEKDYAGAKVEVWMDMLKQRHRPTRWLRANKSGTKINFDFIYTKAEMSAALDELEAYVKTVNREYEFEYELNRGGL